MPRLYLLRHGIADGGGDDPDLSADGISLMEAQAGGLSRLGIRFDAVVTSPLRRAARSARIVANVCGPGGGVTVLPGLAGDLDLAALAGLLEERRAEADVFDHVMVVGHAPVLGRLAGELAGGAGPFPMGRGTLCCLEVAPWPLRPPGQLLFLLPPEVLAAAGTRP